MKVNYNLLGFTFIFSSIYEKVNTFIAAFCMLQHGGNSKRPGYNSKPAKIKAANGGSYRRMEQPAG